MSKEFWFDFQSHRFVGEGPRKCPLCHHAISTEPPLNHTIVGMEAEVTFICPNCDHIFIAYYFLGPTVKRHSPSTLRELVYLNARPSELKDPQLPGSVIELSPSFAKIYREAARSQELSLTQVCGPGYRKAFEFLIKDYAKSKARDDVEKTSIEKSFSGDVVAKHIPDARISSLAKRALWLGNDESHYLRKWEEKDVNDLVTLIELTMHWIEMEHLSGQYVEDMPDSSRS